MRWRCRWFHRFVSFRPLSQWSELYTCSCGKKYAVNHDARAILRWELVEDFYRPDMAAIGLLDKRTAAKEGA